MRFIIKLNIVALLLSCTVCFAQYNNVWLFSDSLGIDFNSGSPVVFPSQVSAFNNETNANVCDKYGNLLFYLSAWPTTPIYGYALQNISGNIVPGGDTFKIDESSTQGALFLPHPADSSLYYLFYHYTPFHSQPPTGFHAALMNKDLNNGNGQVIYKDSVLLSGYFAEKLTAVKHGNGTAWWILIHKGVMYQGPVTNGDCFYKFLLDSSGIHGPYLQCDSFYYSGYYGFMGQMMSSFHGDKVACSLNGSDTVLVYDFDRCNGLLSNRITLKTFNAFNSPYGCSFSGSDNMLYVSNGNYLYQFDLQAPNVQASKTLLWHLNDNMHFIGQHQYAPDNKIYIVSRHGFLLNPPATVYNTYLSVISNPDSAGLNCSFSANSLYLGGRKSSTGLPNMANYSLGAIEPPCVVNISEVANNNNKEFTIYPNPATATLTLNHALATEGESYIVNLYAADGRLVLQKKLTGVSNTVNISMLASGVYYATAQAGDTVLPAVKFIVTR